MGQVVTIAIHKGGVGKTTIVSNMVGGLSAMFPNKKFLIIDTDAQGNGLMAFGRNAKEYKTGLHNVLLKQKHYSECIYQLTDNIDVLPSTKGMDFIEFNILLDNELKKNPFGLLDEAIAELKDLYDLIIVDTPPSLSIVTGIALKISDKVLIPVQPETYSVNGIEKVLQTISSLNTSLNTHINVMGIIGSMVDSRSSVHGIYLSETRKYCDEYGIKMYDTVIPKTVQIANATAFKGLPLILTKPSHATAKAFTELINELLESGLME